MRSIASLLLVVALLGAGCLPPQPAVVPAAGKLSVVGAGLHKMTADVPGIGSVRYAIDVPEGYDGSTPLPLILVLHYGYDGAAPDPYTGADMIEAFGAGLERTKAIVIAPDVLGGDWTSFRNEMAAVWLVQSAMQTYKIDPKRVAVTGFSMGGEGTLYIGSRHQDVFTGAVAVAAPLPSGEKPWTIPLCVIHSATDEQLPASSAKRHADSAKSAGANVEFRQVSGLGHFSVPGYAPHVGDGLAWLEQQWGR